jgi:hypothetical protein
MSLNKLVSACKKLKLDTCLLPCTSIKLKWIKDLNIRRETLKAVQEKARNILEPIGIGHEILNKHKWLSN